MLHDLVPRSDSDGPNFLPIPRRMKPSPSCVWLFHSCESDVSLCSYQRGMLVASWYVCPVPVVIMMKKPSTPFL